MNTEKHFFIMIGRSGCGKGTQSELLKVFLESKDAQNSEIRDTKHITTGGAFREFISSDTYTANKSKEIINAGGLMPEFLAVWNWSNIFTENIKQNQNIILDGAPRKLIEVQALDSAIKFYDYKKPIVIYIDVTREWATKRLLERGREDDNNEIEVNRKMQWFEDDVKKVIDWYAADPRYDFVHVNGEGDIQDVYKEIILKVNDLIV